MEIFISLNGKYPRGEKLIQATRDFERNRISQDELLRIYEQDYEEVKKLQADFKIISDGLLNWQDLIRPFSEILNAQVNGLKRYFETNTFYRILLFQDFEIKNLEEFYKNYFKFGNLAILPSLGIFKYFSENYNEDAIIDVLKTITIFLKEKGYNYFYFQEPSLGFYRDFELLKGLKKLFKTIKKELINEKIILNTYFSDISEFLGEISKMEIDGIGIDFTFNDIESVIKNLKNKEIGILAGIVDNTNSIIESYEDVKFVINKLLDIKPKFLILTGSCDFEFLPREVANLKIEFLKSLLQRY
ncbi:MAG: hypothetical protein ABIL89_04755 [candidate division WOR-3 bacterium]|jgi:methionine synthase II (cobalamin-independent)